MCWRTTQFVEFSKVVGLLNRLAICSVSLIFGNFVVGLPNKHCKLMAFHINWTISIYVFQERKIEERFPVLLGKPYISLKKWFMVEFNFCHEIYTTIYHLSITSHDWVFFAQTICLMLFQIGVLDLSSFSTTLFDGWLCQKWDLEYICFSNGSRRQMSSSR